MTLRAIILYGPPASGKDTITAALSRIDGRFTYLRKLKVGGGRSVGYQHVSLEQLDELRGEGRLAVETHRYGNVYAVDQADVTAMLTARATPVVHMGNIPDVRALSASDPETWFRVRLHVPREVCEQRSRQRGDLDTPERLRAWDETFADLRNHDDGHTFHICIETHLIDAKEAAQTIVTALKITNDH
ncbi:guanylate kinase [Herbidospora galbida]|uniref:Guanylate kinase n=1 Tax=Herbidospora galbida TaxID=2575442 RepID=A0A4U3MHL0_9ACTN|nr:guanylate kinase [Herbidospora galbida]TKK88129.1 guanylate kinase [Herbidospora galbida]